MPGPFIYNEPVTGKNFIGRKQDVTTFSNFLRAGENVVLSAPPKSGKTSLVEQSLISLKGEGLDFTPVKLSFLNMRQTQPLLLNFGSAVLRAFGNVPSDYAELVARYLEGTHFVFDEAVFGNGGSVLSLNWDPDDNDIRTLFALPFRISADRDRMTVVVIDEFQNIIRTEDGDRLCRLFGEAMKEVKPTRCSIVMVGSEVNAMKDIFHAGRHFYRQVEHVKMSEIDTRELIEHSVKGFLNSGKVLDRDLMLGVCKMFRNNPWYVSHLCAVADHLSRGYIMEPILVEALEDMISLHEPKFRAMMSDLTGFQVCLLRAILEGHTKFSSSDVIRDYALSSSANVKRLKDALCKKEIVVFSEDDEPVVQDPLFEYWASKYYFGIK